MGGSSIVFSTNTASNVRKKLSRKLALWIAALVVTISILSGMIEYYVALSNRQEVAKQHVGDLVESVRPTLARFLWEVNVPALDGIVETLSYRRDVHGAWLTAQSVAIVQPREAKFNAAVCSDVLTYDLSKDSPFGRPLGSGMLTVCMQNPPVSTDELLAIVSSLLLRFVDVIIITLGILFIFRTTVFQRIGRLIGMLRSDTDPEVRHKELEKRIDTWDEIDVLEHELRERTQRLLAATERLSQAHKMEALGTLTGGVAHEFNNLLAVISGNLELSQAHNTNERIEGMLHKARISAQDAAQLVSELLSFSGMDRQRKLEIHLNEFVSRVDDRIEPFKIPNVKIRKNVEIDQTLYFDENSLLQAIVNLVKNSIEAISKEEGNIEITIRNATDEEGHRLGNNKEFSLIAIDVVDDGTGVPENLRQRLFEPFFSTKGSGRGVGLGLWTVYNFAEAAGGVAYFEPLETGSRFTLVLPNVESDIYMLADQSDVEWQQVYKGKKVMLVDDEIELLEVYNQYFASLGANVKTSADVTGALELLKSSYVPDILLCDLALDDGSGLEVILKAKTKLPSPLCVLVSGNLDKYEEDTPEVDAVIRKPVPLDVLAQTIVNESAEL